MKDQKDVCNFLGGPLDGRLIRVERQINEYRHAAPPPMTLEIDVWAGPVITKYKRVTGKTFVHETEQFQ